MSNVVSIGLPKRPNLRQRQATLMRTFASHRRDKGDVFWLKENAELLNILATGVADLGHDALDVYRSFYDGLEERMRFFPQYYRFLLSICLDLEDLGLEGDMGERLCAHVARHHLAACELSDLQRAEAFRLLARRGFGAMPEDLASRLTAFIETSETFALPNKKAAYELTHVVFYLSEYGARDPGLGDAAITSLDYAGLLAFLDQDVDLLAEICVALRFAGRPPSRIWEDWLTQQSQGFVLMPFPDGPVDDAYHEYLVTSWWSGHVGLTSFPGRPSRGGLQVLRAHVPQGPLRAISETMYRLGAARSADWDRMRDVLQQSIATDQHRILDDAARSSDRFSQFFQGFARSI